MTITFQLRSKSNPASKPAVITARQLAAFRTFARSHGHLVGMFDDEEFNYLDYGFEARVCPWSWATLARIFDDSEAVIAVIEEAQFLGLNVRFWKDTEGCMIMMAISTTPDGCRPMDLSMQNGRALLNVLGKRLSRHGEIDLFELREILSHNPTRRHIERSGMQSYLEQLDRMADCPTIDDTHLVWF